MAVWAFLPPEDQVERRLISDSLKAGKSRFGWSTEDANDLTRPENHWTDANKEQMFLLRVEEDDWIVHVNVPEHNQCMAARVISTYGFDGGIRLPDGRTDFRHCFEVDTTELVEFGRRDPAVVPSVNLDPRRRFHRVKATDEFHRTLDNVKTGKTANLWPETDPTLDELTKLIHKYHRSKKLEAFLADVFRRVPGVEEVEEPGQRGGTDHGTDLIVRYGLRPLPNVTLVVQVKSYEDLHKDIRAVEQIKTGIKRHDADAGMIVTTAEQIDKDVLRAIEAARKSLGVPIELLASSDVSRFVVRYAPDLLFQPPS